MFPFSQRFMVKVRAWAKVLKFDIGKTKILWVSSTIISTGEAPPELRHDYATTMPRLYHSRPPSRPPILTSPTAAPKLAYIVPSTVEIAFPEPLSSLIYLYSFFEVRWLHFDLPLPAAPLNGATPHHLLYPSSHRSIFGAAWASIVTYPRAGSTT